MSARLLVLQVKPGDRSPRHACHVHVHIHITEYVSPTPPSHPTHLHIPKKKASPDAHADYNALMNCIFSAHRSAVPVDACVLGFEHGGGANGPGPRDSSFLQQAAYITGERREGTGWMRESNACTPA